MRHIPYYRRTLAAALVVIATATGAHARATGEIWSGTSAGFEVHWTKNDINVRQGGRRVFSARDWVKAGLAHFIAVNRSSGDMQPPNCDYQRSIRIVALVGAMMSLEDRTEISCRREAHPGGMTRLITVDLAVTGALAEAGRDAIGRVDPRHPGRAVLLTQLFPGEEILSALASAPPLRDVLRRTGTRPKTLPALLDAVADASGEGDACYIVPIDLLSAFAFDRLDGKHIIMQLGLPGDGPCRMNLTTSDLSFATPESLALAVQRAAGGEEGFLANRGESIAAGRVTTIELHSGRGGGSN
jgi:hypothetical protein